MTDFTATNSTSKMRSDFAQKAVLPETQIAAAEKFVSQLSKLAQTGAPPSEKVIKSGKDLLQNLEQQTEIFMFHAAVLAGQESSTDTDLDSKIEAVEQSVARAEQTSTKLRSALKTFA